jgi:hypothetical protein
MAETSLVVRGVALRQAQGDAKVSGAPMRRGDSPERHAERVEADATSSRPELVEGRCVWPTLRRAQGSQLCLRAEIQACVLLVARAREKFFPDAFRLREKRGESGTRMARACKFAPRERRYSTRTIRVP